MVGTSAIVAFLARKPSMARRSAGTVRTTTGLRGIGINLLGMAVDGFAARGQNPTLSSPSLCRQARELSLAAGGSAHAQPCKDPQKLWDRSQTARGEQGFIIKQQSVRFE